MWLCENRAVSQVESTSQRTVKCHVNVMDWGEQCRHLTTMSGNAESDQKSDWWRFNILQWSPGVWWMRFTSVLFSLYAFEVGMNAPKDWSHLIVKVPKVLALFKEKLFLNIKCVILKRCTAFSYWKQYIFIELHGRLWKNWRTRTSTI